MVNLHPCANRESEGSSPAQVLCGAGGGEVVLAELVPGWAMLVSPPSS